MENYSINYTLDTFYLFFAGFLVMCFSVGLTLFGAGLVRAKNTVDILMKNIVLIAIGTVIYVFLGYAVMYSQHFTNSLFQPNFAGGEQTLLQIMTRTQPANFLPGVFLHCQLAIIPLIIIANVTAERLIPWVLWVFGAIFAGIIYPVMGYWTWGHGFLQQLGFIDQAGSSILHLAGATAACAAILLLGPRLHFNDLEGKKIPLLGANLPLAAVGILFIWLGSIGINLHSQLILSNVQAAQTIAVVIINTQLAIAGSVLATLIASRLMLGTLDLTLILNGVLAGIAAIAASPATVGFFNALLIGIISGVIVLLVILLFEKIKIDDPTGLVAAQGVGGLIGIIAASFTQNYNYLRGLHAGHWNWLQQFLVQWLGVICIVAWVLIVTFIVLGLFKLLYGIRVNKYVEKRGMDKVLHRMSAYHIE